MLCLAFNFVAAANTHAQRNDNSLKPVCTRAQTTTVLNLHHHKQNAHLIVFLFGQRCYHGEIEARGIDGEKRQLSFELVVDGMRRSSWNCEDGAAVSANWPTASTNATSAETRSTRCTIEMHDCRHVFCSVCCESTFAWFGCHQRRKYPGGLKPSGWS
jgi:hypothetical protein